MKSFCEAGKECEDDDAEKLFAGMRNSFTHLMGYVTLCVMKHSRPSSLICDDKLVVSLFCLAFFSVPLMDHRLLSSQHKFDEMRHKNKREAFERELIKHINQEHAGR
jgi:hypothetical protein